MPPLRTRADAPRPTADQVAADRARIAAGGEATTVLAAAAAAPTVAAPAVDRTATFDRTSVLDRPAPRPVPRAPQPAPRSNAWAWALLLVAAIAVGVVAFLLVDRRNSDPGPDAPGISTDLPQQLQDDLRQLQEEAAS